MRSAAVGRSLPTACRLGVHDITASVTDSGGAAGSAAITITITAGEPSTITVSAAADPRVLEANPGTNYGTISRLDVDSPGEESYVRFSVSGVTGAVQSATLRLFVRNGSSNGPSLYNTATAGPRLGSRGTIVRPRRVARLLMWAR